MGPKLRTRWVTAVVALALALGAASGGPLSAPVRTADAASSAPASKHAQAPAHPVLQVGEQPRMRTRYSTTTYNADHTFSTRISGRPVNYRDRLGNWQPIDSTLGASQVPGYAYQNRANSFQALFKKTLADGYLRLVTDGQPISLTMVGASGAGATVSGSTIEYREALPHVWARYAVGSEAIEETLVLQDRAAAASYRFLLQVPAGTAADRRPDGGWGFRIPGRAQPSFILTPPVAYDSAPGHGLDPRDHHARIGVTEVGGGFQVDLTIDQAWLGDPGRRFPVFLDPTITLQPDSSDASFAATCSNCTPFVDTSSGRMYIGTDDQNAWREAIQFDISGISPGATIQSASLGVYWDGWCIAWTNSGYACSGKSYQIDAHRMTAAWSTSSTTAQLQYDSTILSSYTLPASQTYGWMNWDMGAAVKGWYSGAQPTTACT
jgi:hypothetical protein